MNFVEDKFWLQLFKKTGLALPTFEGAEAELRTAKPIPLTDELMKTIVLAASIGKQAKAVATSDKRLSTEVDDEDVALPAHKERQPLFAKFEQILAQIGSPLVAAACQAIDALLKFENSHQDYLFKFFNNRLSVSVSPVDRQILEDAMHPLGSGAEVVAYYDQKLSLSPAEACVLIKHPSTKTSALVSTRHERRIFLAVVNHEEVAQPIPCKAFWLRLSEECHVFVVSTSLPEGHDRSKAICHELNEMLDYFRRKHSLVSERKEDMNMNEGSAKTVKEYEPERESFVKWQMCVDAKDKEVIAQWISRHYTLRDGAGIVIDAGSACLAMWEKIIDQIRDGKYSYMVVLTNSMLVLENWGQWRTSPGVQRTSMELAGTKLDWEHLAFYGEEADLKVTKPGFRAMNVYIGTSGIEFDEKTGSIRFGCLGPAAEPQLKKRLFECRASRRIILATPRKMGFAGARAFNVLDTEDLNADAPIYLVTTNPESGSVYEEQFNQSLHAFQSKAVEQAIVNKGLEFHWVTIDRDSKDAPRKLYEIVIPRKTKEERCQRDAREQSLGKSATQQ